MMRFLFLIAAFISEGAMAQNNMGPVSNNQGIITQGQVGNNTINIHASVRAQFTDKIRSDILQMIPKDKRVDLKTIGGAADQAIGDQVEQYMVANGYSVTRYRIGMFAPPPDQPFTLQIGDNVSSFMVSPSAR
jgi:hypothetical protein